MAHLPVLDDAEGHDAAGPESCAGCSDRRSFLRESVSATLALVGLSLLAPTGTLTAMPSAGAGGGAKTVRYPIPAVDGVLIDKRNEVMLCRSANAVYAFALACPHQNTALRALPGTAGFQCPRHKSRYQPDGTFISGRATRNMDRLPITRDGDSLVVDATVAYASDADASRWTAAMVRL